MAICFIYYYTSGARNIRALKVKCSNLGNGCQWTGRLEELETHLQSCDCAHLPCTNECKNNDQVVKILRKNLRNHLTNKCPRRQYQCPHCEEMGEHQERTTSHLETCPQVKVQCPNAQCEASIPRCEVSTNRSTCEYEPLSCKYTEVGCEERPLRKDLKKHEEDDQLHLRITKEKVLQISKLLGSRITSRFNFKLTNFQMHRKDNKIFYSPPFRTSSNGYKICVGVYANGNGEGQGTHLSAYAFLMKGENDDYLTWPFTGNVKIELLNQLEDNHHHNLTANFPADNTASNRVVDGERGTGWGWHKFISHTDLEYQPDLDRIGLYDSDDSDLYDPDQNSQLDKNYQYLKDDTLIFRVTAEQCEEHSKPWLVCPFD